MPIPKTKATATASTKTKNDAPPVDTSDEAAASTGKPDKTAYDAEQAKFKSEIDALQAKLNGAREKASQAGKGGTASERRNALRSELDELFNQQAGNKPSRTKTWDQVKALDEGIKQKIKDLQAAKAKVPFKSTAEVDSHVKSLETKVESGSMKLAEEKRALQEISQLKRTRRQVETFQATQESIEADRASVEELKTQLNDPAAKAVSDRITAIKAELNDIKKADDEAYSGRNKLYAERDGLQAQLNDVWTKKKAAMQQYREAGDRYWAKVNEDRARRAERAKTQRAEEEAEKKKEVAQRIREEAEAPAFQAQVEDCQTLIDFFSGKSTGAVTLKTAPNFPRDAVAGVAKLEIRQVEAVNDMVIRKKKGEEEENYFVGGKGKKGKKTKAAAESSDAPAPSSNQLNVPLPTLSALLTLSIPPPGSSADVPRVIEDLKKKKAWFEANQARVTAENISRAEAEVQRLNNIGKPDGAAAPANGTPVSDVSGPNGGGERPAEPAPTPKTSDVLSTSPPSEEVIEKLEEVKEEEATA